MTSVRSDSAKVSGRKASKEVRRAQLIEATIDSIAKRGYAATTMADVADGAALSRGIVNFHFESKENLLAETLKHMATFYRLNWEAALVKGGADPAKALWEVVRSDFERKVCNRRIIAAWSGLRAEARSRPAYRRICGEHDDAFRAVLFELFAALKKDGKYTFDAEKLALVLESLLEGMWLQILMGRENMTRQQAHACTVGFLVTIFPKHYTNDGPIDVNNSENE